MTRREPQPAELIDRAQTISFSFDGDTVAAHPGDTIASALFAAGRRTFSRSFKYHRRRGLMCCSGQCPNCLVAVDGAPGIRACTEPAREGARVEHLNARPGLEHDAMAITDKLGGPFTPPGFYYKTFIRPRKLWPLYEKVLRGAAGLGVLPEKQAERTLRTEYRRRHADVLVVGGGLAGLTASIAAAGQGADVVLVDDGPAPGGRLLWEGGHDQARRLTAQAQAAGVEVLRNAPALGHFDGLVPAWQDNTLHQIRAKHQIYATGAIEQPLMFAGNDLPGVMLSGGARRLASLWSVLPGRRAVIATSSDRGIRAAIALQDAGVEIVLVADMRSKPTATCERLRTHKIEARFGWTVIAAEGRRQVSRVTLAPIGAASSEHHDVDCDLLIVSGGDAPATALVTQAGGRTGYDKQFGVFALTETPPGVFACGQLAGEGTYQHAGPSGELAGLLAAEALGLAGGRAGVRRRELRAWLDEGDHVPQAIPAPWSPERARGRAFACLCEDVTAKDIAQGIAEGYDSIELCKRFTTVTMGPCQGRMCQLTAIRQMAAGTGQRLSDIGTTTARPPWSTVPLAALAGRSYEPTKRSPIHRRHLQLGASIRWAGDWLRAYDYGDPEGEALAVHASAGLIDVSTLGKLLVRGPDAGAFLDRLYPNRVSSLNPGRVRYGVLTSDAGRIMDDGTVARLDETTFYVTTTSSGAGAVEQWFSWWLADWQMDVELTDVSQALAAVNLAGPRARDILTRVTSLDCSPEAFGYLDARQTAVAGVNALLLRIGFTGELGYELHLPSAHGEHVWDALLEAGGTESLRPFGLEPQRILRLQKQHIIVGQDTDSESTPLNAGMPWAVKLDKPEAFIGRWALEHAAAHPGASALVGFTLPDGVVPREGAVVLDAAGDAAGQVTSARRSRQLDQVIGMAWVPSALAADGEAITVLDRGKRLTGAVLTTPFHDPDGTLVRS
ncbi:MAG TPA: 2Fe-2S iron-sulfur cluster-binding protein [Solirubrobacteraceae bacterium]|nr:2Fe-2S iron-sulfur cluster-binding protein [Solirubrobacteraceae bacterium]